MAATDPASELADLRERVRAWIADDPEEMDRNELQTLIDSGQWTALQERFASRLEFGTAGLRAEMGAGPSRMNRATVALATAALCAELRASVPDALARGLCIGFDGRHRSRSFADEAASIAAGAGFVVHRFERATPTPLLAFSVVQCRAAAGIMITASHNPARDNGYKVYADNGAQILPPFDTRVARAMGTISSICGLARCEQPERVQRGLERELTGELDAAYQAAIGTPLRAAPADAAALCIAHTSLHGVGDPWVKPTLARAGFSIHCVTEQALADPDFPTVAFPNPEEPGALDRLFALAERCSADIALANDPDADRLAVVARDEQGALRMLTGNEVGVLLADALLREDRDQGPRFVLSSIVSTPMIGAIARAHGAHWEPTLTGFKWICNRALELSGQTGARFVFGFEEALGYCIGNSVRDKDGIASALAIAGLAARLKRQGQTLHGAFEALSRVHGFYASAQVALRVVGPDAKERLGQLMAQVRHNPPNALGPLRVMGGCDLLARSCFGSAPPIPPVPATDALWFELEGGHRVMLRPSGTEPKLKAYLDVREPLGATEAIASARMRADATLAVLASALRTRFGPT